MRQTAFFMRSALNGSHGEATNSDDVVNHLALAEMVDSELEVALDHFGLKVSVRVILQQDDELMNFALLCGALTSVVQAPESMQGLVDSLFLVKLCIAEELSSTLSYTELLYDLFIHRNLTLKRNRRLIGEEFFHFMMYDVDNAVQYLGSSPRESQLRSSHGEMTEGDDLAYSGQTVDQINAQLVGTRSSPGPASPKQGGAANAAHNAHFANQRVEENKRKQKESGKNGEKKPVSESHKGQPVVDVISGVATKTPTPQQKVVEGPSDCREKKIRRVVIMQVDWKDYVDGPETIKFFSGRKVKPFYFNGEVYTDIQPDSFAKVVNHQCMCREVGPGYVKIVQTKADGKAKWRDDDEENRLQPIIPLVMLAKIDGYRRNTLDEQCRMDVTKIVVFPPVQHYVLLPMFARLQKLPNTGVDKLHDRATECSVDRVSSLVIPSWLIAETVAHRRDQLARAEVLHHNTDSLIKITKYGGAVGLGDLAGLDHLLQQGSIEKYEFVHIEHKRLTHVPDYPVRDDFTIIEGDEYTDDENRVSFSTGQGALRNQYSTRICGFNGLNQPVGQMYANDAGSMNHGCKRILGAKDDADVEFRLRSNAKSLGKNIMLHKGVLNPWTINPEAGFYQERGFYEANVRDEPRRTWWSEADYDQHKKGWSVLTRRDQQLRGDHPKAYLNTQNPHASKFIAGKAHKLALGCQRYQVRRVLDSIQTGANWVYYKLMVEWLDLFHSSFTRQQVSNLPHLKRKLRQAYCRGIRCHDPSEVLLDRMKASIKNELSKFGKAPRLTHAMGRGCLYAPELVEFAKVLIDGIHVEKCGEVTMIVMVFGKRKDGDLEKLFNDMYEAMSCVNTVVCGVYSDDMVIAGSLNTPTGVEAFAYNVDVASNDSSQDLPSFLTTFMILNQMNSDRALGLIEQCMKPIEIRNPEVYDEVVRVLFHGPFEGSGSTLTTLLNHVGSYLILMGTLFHFGQLVGGPSGPCVTVEECIRSGAAEVGHQVTVESCSDGIDVVFEKVTFLHMHPARLVRRPESCCFGGSVPGLWIPRIDIGCILRKFGWVDGSLTHVKLGLEDSPASIALFGAMSQQQQMDAYCGGVVRGWKNEAADPILVALRNRFTEDCTGVIQTITSKDAGRTFVRDDLNYSECEICPSTLRNRYNISDAEIEAIVCGISMMHVGTFIVTSGVSKILHVCYGITEVRNVDQWERVIPHPGCK